MVVFLHTSLVLIISILQVSLLSQFRLLQAAPNLILVAIISWCILKEYKNAFIWAIGSGFILDLFSDIFFGFYMVSFLLTALIVYYLIYRFVNIDTIYSRIGIIVLATVISNLILAVFFIILSFLKLEYTQYLRSLGHIVSGEIILNIILILLVYNLVKKFQEFIIIYKERVKIKT